jgi:hypothetical protein
MYRKLSKMSSWRGELSLPGAGVPVAGKACQQAAHWGRSKSVLADQLTIYQRLEGVPAKSGKVSFPGFFGANCVRFRCSYGYFTDPGQFVGAEVMPAKIQNGVPNTSVLLVAAAATQPPNAGIETPISRFPGVNGGTYAPILARTQGAAVDGRG